MHASVPVGAAQPFCCQAGHHCNAQGLQGSWECFDGFQGTMRAPTWAWNPGTATIRIVLADD